MLTSTNTAGSVVTHEPGSDAMKTSHAVNLSSWGSGGLCPRRGEGGRLVVVPSAARPGRRQPSRRAKRRSRSGRRAASPSPSSPAMLTSCVATSPCRAPSSRSPRSTPHRRTVRRQALPQNQRGPHLRCPAGPARHRCQLLVSSGDGRARPAAAALSRCPVPGGVAPSTPTRSPWRWRDRHHAYAVSVADTPSPAATRDGRSSSRRVLVCMMGPERRL
jgi:hypothetical protein